MRRDLLVLGLYILGAIMLGIMAGAIQYAKLPESWPEKVLDIGIGVAAGLIGVPLVLGALFRSWGEAAHSEKVQSPRKETRDPEEG